MDRRFTRSQGEVKDEAGSNEASGQNGSIADRVEDAASVVHSRSSRKSTRSTNAASSIAASEQRLHKHLRVIEMGQRLRDIIKSIRVAELNLTEIKKESQKEFEKLKDIPDICSDEYLAVLETVKKLEGEEENISKQLRLLKLDETFASLDLKAAQETLSAVDKHAQHVHSILGEDDDDNLSQKLSEDEEEPETLFEDATSVISREEEFQQLKYKLPYLRGKTPPPPNNPPLNPTSQPQVTIATEPCQSAKTVDTGNTPMVQQLVDVFSQAFGKINPMIYSNPTTSINPVGEKMLARQAMKMELSPFDGNSAEWPVFIQQYHTVSKACGFTEVENLHRLQRALKGEARSAVSSLLVAPENVNEILEVLTERFGNPRLVVHRLVQKAQELKSVKDGDYGAFLNFIDIVRNITTTAEAMKCGAYLSNPDLLIQLVKKLPQAYQMKWAEHLDTITKLVPDLSDLALWLKTISKHLMRLYEPICSSKIEKPISAVKPLKAQKSFAVQEHEKKKTTENKKCRACDREYHHLSKCSKFEAMSVDERWNWVRSHRYCFSCLNYGHAISECRGKKNCGVDNCDKPHHKKLHEQKRPRIEVTTTLETTEILNHAVDSCRINMNILPIVVKGPKGSIKTFAMLDTGAGLTVMDAEVADKLGIKGPTKPLTHCGLHDAVTVNDSRIVQVEIVSQDGKEFKLKNVRTVPDLPLPLQSVKGSTIKKWPHLKEVPISLYQEAMPTILIGNDHADLCNTSQLVFGPGNAPIAGKTKLGWVLMGRVGAEQQENVSYHFREETEDDLHQLVKHHFSTEAFGVKPNVEKPRSREDARAIKIMESTLKRVGVPSAAKAKPQVIQDKASDVTQDEASDENPTQGGFGSMRWECGLLWKEDEPKLPENSREAALRRLHSIEKKMDASKEYADFYCGKMAYYEEKGYARKLSRKEAEEITPKTYYLSHFLAENPKKANKKRFVLDAKYKTGGKSLNDCLCAGPDTLNSLPGTLFKFRERAIGVTADVKDMFHRVGVIKEDAKAQQLLWRGMDRNRDPDVFQMDVLIFGATCSPAIAQEAKNKNAKLFIDKYPEAVQSIINNMYVDDKMNSFDLVKQAFENFLEVREIMNYGNFDLRGWLSNSQELMELIPEDLRGALATALELGDEDAVERVLGLFWKPIEDIFTFSLNYLRTKEELMNGTRRPTKRELLSLVMSLFDPLGFLSHFTVRGKMLLQDAWRSKIGWDDEIKESSGGKWEHWRDALLKIQEFSLPRCYSLNFSSCGKVTLHMFVDASEQAYGAVAYFVIDGKDGKEISFVESKARVAPLKPLSIPRMELQAAVLGARLSIFIRNEHTIKINRTVYWSDSQTVLCWLQSDGRKFQQFVAHRVGEIQELTNPDEWRWVPTKFNVADEMTRDADPCDWSPSSRWINGPEFLKEEEELWPKGKEQLASTEVLELKKEYLCVAVKPEKSDIIRVEDYSSWTRLIRVTARLFQCLRKLKKTDTSPYLSNQDLASAENFWCKKVQEESFNDELKSIKEGKPLPKTSSVRYLELHIDSKGILRLSGRLEKADVETNVKFPVLLDRKHPYTRLLISHFHETAGHHGFETVVNELRQKFHIPHLRAAVKGAWINCQLCKNNRAIPRPPQMGQLPASRVDIGGHPFTNTGLDYFGPMEVWIRRSKEKRWGALFTCLSTRAVHLEIAASLSTDSCILAIRRFVCRRGCPKKLFSDNGTNFHGANNELKRAILEIDQEKMSSECAKKGIDWHFNPPSAPHMGGSWERLVRSVKVALNAILKEQVPSEEVLQTLMVEAEHSVNSHPLTHVSIDANDPEALTPNHFLIGRSSNMAPPGIFEKTDLLRKSKWRRAQYLADSFWKRWVKEYLPTLQRRGKWTNTTEPVKIGDVAVEVDPQQPRNTWRKGIVTAVFPGEDGIIRVVDFKTSSGTYRRPVAKLAFLDVCREEAAPFVTKDAAASLVSGRMSPPDNI